MSAFVMKDYLTTDFSLAAGGSQGVNTAVLLKNHFLELRA